jgi:hypothetical protein
VNCQKRKPLLSLRSARDQRLAQIGLAIYAAILRNIDIQRGATLVLDVIERILYD